MLTVPERPGTETLRVPVLKVFDGDGFLTRVALPGTRKELEVAVRFGFIDAPELSQPGGREAQQFLSRLIGKQWVDLAILQKSDTNKIVDAYRRLVAVPYLHERGIAGEALLWRIANKLVGKSIMRNVELEMVLNGWAWVMDRYGPDQRYHDALADAQRHRRGIWARDDALDPWEYKKQKYRARGARGMASARAPAHCAKRVEAPVSMPYQASVPVTASATCPSCSAKLVRRQGRHGAFLGCSSYPRCRYSKSLGE